MTATTINHRRSALFLEVLSQMRCTLLVSTGAGSRLIAVGAADDQVVLSMRELDQPTGIAVRDRQLAVTTRTELQFMQHNARLVSRLQPPGRFDRLYLGRSTVTTGDIESPELAWGERDDGDVELWMVNTRFSCLASVDERYGLTPRWRPPFISRLAPDDRCHLSGLAMREGHPGYVTAFSQTDQAGGWRAQRQTGGVMLDVATGEVVTSGLAMPHSPRLHREQLLVLNSGRGTLEAVDADSGQRTEIESLPGFPRGLACYGNLAFVGVSRTADDTSPPGAPVAERRCGVAVIDLDSGQTVATFEFASGIDEIRDIQVLTQSRCVSLGSEPALPLSDEEVVALIAQGTDARHAGRMQDALELLVQASDARPQAADIATRLGDFFLMDDNKDGAVAAYARAVAADRDFAPALQPLGHLLADRGQIGDGVRMLQHALEVAPTPRGRVLEATVLPIIYRDHADVVAWRERLEERAQALADDDLHVDIAAAPVPTNFYAVFQGYNDRELNLKFADIYRGIDVNAGRAPQRRADGRLRIGFLSAHFRNHTIGILNYGRIEHLDRERFEVIVLAAGVTSHPAEKRFEGAADRYVPLPTDAVAARQVIAEQELDLLFFADVGMDVRTYPLTFSRMAPVQAVTWGHPVTTGSATMDYFVSSEQLEIPGADEHYSERLVRLPSLGTYYHRPEVPPVDGIRAEMGIADDAHLYACPQTLFKFHPDNDLVFGEILRRDPKGVLLLIEPRAPAWRRLLDERFARSFGEVADRVRWLKQVPRGSFLRLLAASDVALDPLVFGGGNSTYETLAAGTPVVTLPTEFLRGRISRALYTKMGFTELVCASPEEYVEQALRLANDADYRAHVVARIAETVDVLFEDASEVRDLEAFFETAVAEAMA